VFLKKKFSFFFSNVFPPLLLFFSSFILFLNLGSDFLNRKLIQNCHSTFKADSYKNENQNSFNFETGKNKHFKQNSTSKNKN